MGYSIILLLLSFYRYTLSDCDSFSIGGCKNEEFLIASFPLDDIQDCQDICYNFNECSYFASLNGMCYVYKGFSRSDCENYSGSPDQNVEDCLLGDNLPQVCDSFISEECVFTGRETGFSAPPGQTPEPLDCQEHCLIVQPAGGCEYWVYDRSDLSCRTLDSAERTCTGVSGPKTPKYSDCPVSGSGCETLDCDENAQQVNSTQEDSISGM